MNATERLADPGFGNYMLNGLREIALPDPPSYRPQTIGWLVLAILGLLVILVWSIQHYRSWHKNRYRRVALNQLHEIEQRLQNPSTRLEALHALPVLVKRTALAAYPRETVASLHSDAWLSFLDSSYSGTDFTQGNGRLLSQLSYQPPEAIAQLPEAVFTDLITATRRWIVLHG